MRPTSAVGLNCFAGETTSVLPIHSEVAALELPDQDRWLNWADETDPPRSRKDLRSNRPVTLA